MNTIATIIRADGTEEKRELDWPQEPDYFTISVFASPILGAGRPIEHVTVLHDGQYTDMFVDECGLLDNLPRNEKATAIYRNNVLTNEPGTDPDSLPHIAGTAILMSRRVWF